MVDQLAAIPHSCTLSLDREMKYYLTPFFQPPVGPVHAGSSANYYLVSCRDGLVRLILVSGAACIKKHGWFEACWCIYINAQSPPRLPSKYDVETYD